MCIQMPMSMFCALQPIVHRLVRTAACVQHLLHVSAYLDGVDPVVQMVRHL